MDRSIKTVAIIGAGPAGMAAALQLDRFCIKFILFEDQKQNSLLVNAWRVESCLCVCPGQSGIKLLRQFQDILTKNKIKKTKKKVDSFDYNFKTQLFEIKTVDKKYNADFVVVASGTKPKLLNSRITSDVGSHLFYEALPLVKKRNKTIVIIGAGDAAFDNAINLAKNNKVIICNRTKHIDALPLLVKKANKHHNIRYFCNYVLKDLISLGTKKKVECKFINKKKGICIEADYVLAAIGRSVQKDFYSESLKKQEKNLIRNKKLFLAGDVKNNKNRQVPIAVGDGINAAMDVYHRFVAPLSLSSSCLTRGSR